MDKNFEETGKRECNICLYDLHLSAACCPCSPDIYSCLKHVKHLCSCARTEKIFLFRYEISELNILVEALEGKLSAVYRWARDDLKLALHLRAISQARESKQAENKSRHSAPVNGIEQYAFSGIKAEKKAWLGGKDKDEIESTVVSSGTAENSSFINKEIVEVSSDSSSDSSSSESDETSDLALSLAKGNKF